MISPLKSESDATSLAAVAEARGPGVASTLDVSAPLLTIEPSAGIWKDCAKPAAWGGALASIWTFAA